MTRQEKIDAAHAAFEAFRVPAQAVYNAAMDPALKEYEASIAAARAKLDAIEVPALVAFRATIATTMAAYDVAVLTAADDPDPLSDATGQGRR